MPISANRFEAIGEEGVTPETNAEIITRFLLENHDQAWEQKDIVERTDVKQGSVGPTLKRLEDRGVVDHRLKWWRISDSYRTSEEAAVFVSETAEEYDDGQEFDAAAWAEHAEDDRAEKYTE
ncbi:MarR family transcriptional regulator [Halomarina rubra]|uniref:MarR family transcriptional regulator n=1 Tax=Halomarina rubra TaxID=2071873 RepID=A0ABD6AU69_9EURY|nr:helix-turn-helix domain-containing protein [Halomarina rubra]